MRLRALSVRPIHTGDLAQAWLFDDILQNEIAELQEAADTIAALERDQSHREELRRLRTHIKEVRRLLEALRRRFPPA
jgi:FtsZ-binding cell division protein ZapB